jgi:hypothetical protein
MKITKEYDIHTKDSEKKTIRKVVDLVSSLQLKSEDIGLDLKRTVSNTNVLYRICFVCISYVFRKFFVFYL